MQNPVLAAQVHEIVSRGLDLHERLERGEAADFTTEHDQLRKLLWGEGEAAANPEYAGAIGIGASASGAGSFDANLSFAQSLTEAAKAALPKGAYVPFGGGSRTCIGMRFGQAEIAVIARKVLRAHRLELVPGYKLSIRHAPTISPRGGLPMTVRAA